MTVTDLDLLRQYASDGSQAAFTALVQRHVNLVYSAALRQIRSPHLAEEITQSVFADLARDAAKLMKAPGGSPVLTAWLYQVARRTAIDAVRQESRRQLREQVAVEMNDMNATAADWTHIEPLLDDAMAALSQTDRTAILLRYFQNKSLTEVGRALGTSDDAAQKRVSRAVDQLREFFDKRKVTVGASGLAVLISANAVQAAPAGLTATIATTALAGTAVATSAVIAATKTIAMTTLQKTIIAAMLATAIGTGVYEAHQASQLREQNRALQQSQVPLAEQNQQLQRERDKAMNLAANLRAELLTAKTNNLELMRLRSDATRLRQDSTEMGQIKAALSQPKKETADAQNNFVNLVLAEAREAMTNSIDKTLASLKIKIGLTPEQAQQINNILQGDIEALAQNELSMLTGDHSRADVISQEKNLQAAEDSQIAALLTADQQAAYEEVKNAQAASAAMNYAKSETSAMNSYLELSPVQSQAVVSILANLPAGQGGQGNSQDTDAKEQLEIRLQALSQTLTPDQLEKYRTRKLAAIQQAVIGIQLMKALAK